MKFLTLLALFGVITARESNQKESKSLWRFIKEKQDLEREDPGVASVPVEEELEETETEEPQQGAKQLRAIIRNKAQRTMVKQFFKEMLATTKDNKEATFRCLTVQVYGEQAMNKFNFLDKETTCPCLLQRLCFLVADEIDEERPITGPVVDDNVEKPESEDSLPDTEEEREEPTEDDSNTEVEDSSENERLVGSEDEEGSDNELERDGEFIVPKKKDQDQQDRDFMKSYKKWLKKENKKLRAQAKWCEKTENREKLEEMDSDSEGETRNVGRQNMEDDLKTDTDEDV